MSFVKSLQLSGILFVPVIVYFRRRARILRTPESQLSTQVLRLIQSVLMLPVWNVPNVRFVERFTNSYPAFTRFLSEPSFQGELYEIANRTNCLVLSLH